MRILIAPLLLLFSGQLQAGKSDDILMAFAEACRNGRVASGVPADHQLRLVAFSELVRGQYAMVDSPYITGPGHRLLDEYMGEEFGAVKTRIFLGEVQYNEKGQIVRLLDRSGFGHEKGNQSDPHKMIELLKKYSPHLVPPEGIKIEKFGEVQHLDGRLSSGSTDNLRHDAIDPAVTAFLYTVEGVLSESPGRAQRRKSAIRDLKRILPTLRLYSAMMGEEGYSTTLFNSALDHVGDGILLPDSELAEVLTLVRKSRPGHRSEAENMALIRATIFP